MPLSQSPTPQTSSISTSLIRAVIARPVRWNFPKISSAERSGLQQKPRVNEEDSSLLQIVDSWHSSKEGKDKTDNSENSEGLVLALIKTNGISITTLRSELKKSNISLDKKFSSFLLSMPHIFRLQSRRDGKFHIHGIFPKAGELSPLRLYHSPEVNFGVAPGKIQQTPSANGNLVKVNAEKPQEEVQKPFPVHQKTTEASNDEAPESLHNHVLEQDYTRVGKDHDNLAGKDNDLPGKPVDSAYITEKHNNSTLKKCTGVSSDREGMKQLRKQVKATLGRGQDYLTGLPASVSFGEVAKTEGSFWEDMEILIDSPRGSLSVTQSRTRFVNSHPLVFTAFLADKILLVCLFSGEMAENLLKEGPFVLRSLSNTDLLHLVDLLISDKKWIEECPSQASPFKITEAAGKSPSLGHSHAANGLRLIFMRTPSQANLQTEHEGEKKLQNIPYSGVSSTILDKNSSDRSRFQVLSDCQNLVKDILKEHPKGHNVANFRTLFLERYGYPLDIQRLGYKNLASVLKNVPRIKIESTYILLASMVPDDFGPETTADLVR
ncbi:Coupling TraD [Gossypium australe]|uniref:Coupling TraD n=1 Tax=Gossypium australe TaxID=47621 RepID=A0A5B6VUU2_9ROSI|nr:Coupling TraD [Gossypium australe]